MQINDTQRKIYEFLVERSTDGVPPSVREIGAAVGLRSTSSVQSNLDALEAAGYIQRDPLLKRSIRIMGQADNVTQVPILGTVTAGAPILAVEQIEGYFPYTGTVSRDKPLFALHVRGESMIQAGILDGDLVIAEKTPFARNGEIVETDISYALILDRMNKGKLKDGDLDKFSAEQVEAMKAFCAMRKSELDNMYALANLIS